MAPAPLRRNIELKARLRDPAAARRVAERLATERLGRQRQRDTYFVCPQGRLKLREIEGQAAQLIWYARPDEPGSKASDYRLVAASDPLGLKEALASALGVRCVVEKERDIFLWRNVRIHLDEVRGLGSFLEFEAVLGPEHDDALGHAQLQELAAAFGLEDADLRSGSYGEAVETGSEFPRTQGA